MESYQEGCEKRDWGYFEEKEYGGTTPKIFDNIHPIPFSIQKKSIFMWEIKQVIRITR